MFNEKLKQFFKIKETVELLDALKDQRITSMENAFNCTDKKQAQTAMTEFLFIDNLINKIEQEEE